MRESELRLGCIGAGCSGAGHLIWFEERIPGCCVAFCDPDRRRFDELVAGHLASGSAVLRRDFGQLPHYTDPDEMIIREHPNTVVIASHCENHAASVECCVRHGVNILLEKPIAISEWN